LSTLPILDADDGADVSERFDYNPITVENSSYGCKKTGSICAHAYSGNSVLTIVQLSP
jgi:hypothetical protein